MLHLLHLLQGGLPPSEGAVEGGGETSGCFCINFWLFLWKSPVVFVGLFSRNGVFFFRNLGRIIGFGENWFLGGFINMHRFFVFLFGNNRFLDTISI